MHLYIKILHWYTSITYLQYSKLGLFYFSFLYCFLGGGREIRRRPQQGKMWLPQGPVFQSKKLFKHCRVKQIVCISRQSQPKKGKIEQALVHFQIVRMEHELNSIND